jgi:hypothetical protein
MLYKDPASDVWWFKLDHKDGTASYVSMFADGTLNEWQMNKENVQTLSYKNGGKELLWGTVSQDAGEARKVCEIGTDICHWMPENDFYFLGPPKVNKTGLVHALIQDAVDSSVYIWRSPL